MEEKILEQMISLCEGIVFRHRYYESDALILLNWCRDHQRAKVFQDRVGYMSLCSCGRCSNIVGKGDRFCSNCGRE